MNGRGETLNGIHTVNNQNARVDAVRTSHFAHLLLICYYYYRSIVIFLFCFFRIILFVFGATH